MSGTRVTAEDINTGESEAVVIRDDYVLICDGEIYLDSAVHHANGTTVLMIKRRTA